MLLTRRQSLMAVASFLATAWAAKNVLAQGEVSGAQKDAIDKVLRQAVERGDVPGVVVAVTDRERTIYEGAFGERGQRCRSDPAPVVVDDCLERDTSVVQPPRDLEPEIEDGGKHRGVRHASNNWPQRPASTGAYPARRS